MPLDPQLDPHFEEAGRLNNLDPNWLRALALGESGGRAGVTSEKNAGGLMQIIPSTAKQYGIADPYDPVQAIYGGARILNDAMTKAEALKAAGRDINPADHALRTYFAGDEGPKWKADTAAYPGRIASKYRELQGGAEPAAVPVSPIDALAAAKYATIPAPGAASAKNFTTPPGTPDTLDAAPPGVAAAAGYGPPAHPADALDRLSPNPTRPVQVASAAPGNGWSPAGAPAGPQTAQASPANDDDFDTVYDQARKLFGRGGEQPTGAPVPVAPGVAQPAAQPATTQPATAQPASPSTPGVPVADPANAMYPATMIPHLMTFPAGVAIAQQLHQLAEKGFQLNKDSTLSPVKGGPADPALLQQSAGATAAGTGAGGLPSKTEEAKVKSQNELVEATIDLGDGRGPHVMKVPRSALLGQGQGGQAPDMPPLAAGGSAAAPHQVGTPYLPPAAEAGFRELSTADAKDIVASRSQAEAGQKDMAVIQAIQDFLPKVATGWKADTKLEGARILKAAGVADATINDWLKTDVASGQLLNKNFLVLSAAAVRNMGAREPGTVISLFTKAYPNLETDQKAIAIQGNALYMDRVRSLQEAEAKSQYYNESLTLHQADPTKYRGMTGFAPEFNKVHSPELYLHAAEAMGGAEEAWKAATTPDQRAAIHNLIPSGRQFLGPDGKMRVKQ